MKRFLLQSITLVAALMPAIPSLADPSEFSFGVVARRHVQSFGDASLRTAIDETDADNLAFVVVHGVKASDAPCTDNVYLRQKALLESAGNGIVALPAASDWAKCPADSSKASAIGKLTRLRELFFFDDFSLGASRIPVIRQSTIAKFRSFTENSRWQIGAVMFATVNLPSNNNNYVSDAGRNSEFEDRLVANRDWINRVFTFAQREKAIGIVLFCDGNPLSAHRSSASRRDGYTETRKQIVALAGKFPGKILIVHSQPAKTTAGVPAIRWRGNLGEISPITGWTKVNVDSSQASLFSLELPPAQAVEARR